MSLSIRWRLALGILIAFVLTTVIMLLTVHFSLLRIVASELDSDLSRDANRVQAQVALVGSLADTAKLQEVIGRNSLSGAEEAAFVTVIRDTEGRVLLDDGGQEVATAGIPVVSLGLTREELDRVLAGEAVSRRVELAGGRQFRFRTERLAIGGRIVGVVQVAEDVEAQSSSLDRLQLILVAEGAAAVVVALAIAFWLSRGAVTPLEKVIDVAAEIEASDLHRRIAARNQPAEVQKLADTFDAMLARLDKAFEEQKNFVLDISHDLRTPLTALRGNIDVMLMDDRLDGETRGHLERMQSEVARLIRLTTNLLYLASAHVGREPERRPVEMDVLCLEVCRQGRHLRPDVKLTLGREDQVTVLGDRDLLKQMILNLVENGMKYTQSGGRVNLSVSRNGEFAQIAVEDNGPGIPPEALPHIFERFYRGDDRSKRGGSGLGLTIADWIARSHGGRIEVKSEVGQGSVFTVSLPLAGGGGDSEAGLPQADLPP